MWKVNQQNWKVRFERKSIPYGLIPACIKEDFLYADTFVLNSLLSFKICGVRASAQVDSMLTTISPSDLAHGVIVAHVVFSSRDKAEHKWNPILALCYLAEAVDIPRSRQYNSFIELSTRFDSIVGVKDGLEDMWQSMLRIDSIDDFSLLVESMGNALIPNPNMSFNDLNGPSLVTPDSNIGIFLRSLLVQWECLQFDETCDLFEKMQSFLKQPASSRSEAARPVSTAVFDSPYRLLARSVGETIVDGGALRLRAAANLSILQGDIAETERVLHCLFDQNGTDPLRCSPGPSTEARMPGSPVISSEASISRTLLELQHSDETARSAATKHQHAMLSLADMWMRADNHPMALSAIEEALKTAHQRGDHAAVAQSLILLHSVFESSNDPTLVASVEDILMRCTTRSAALDLQHLTSHSALLLAQLRTKQPFKDNTLARVDDPHHGDSAVSTHQGPANPIETASWRVEDIWTQISFSLLGEIALTRQVVTAEGILEDTEFTQSGASNSMMGPQANNAAKKENLKDVPLSVGPELVRLSLQASLVASELWARLGMLHMAQFACLRAIKQFAKVAAAEDIAMVYIRLLHFQVQTLCIGTAPSGSSFEPVKALAKRMRAALPAPSLLPRHVVQQLDRVEVLIAAHTAYANEDISKALRLAHRLADLSLVGTSASATSCSSSPHNDENFNAHMSGSDFDAQVLLIELTARFDSQASQEMLEGVRASCAKAGSLGAMCLCSFLKGKYLLERARGDEAVAQAALKTIEEALSFARKIGLGLVEAQIAQFSSESV